MLIGVLCKHMCALLQHNWERSTQIAEGENMQLHAGEITDAVSQHDPNFIC